MEAVEGAWKVRRISGLLPPFGVHKRIRGGKGWTLLGKVKVAPFRVEGSSLRYRLLPVRDELEPMEDGTFEGRGYLLGLQFCRFRMLPEAPRLHSRVTARKMSSRRRASKERDSGKVAK